MSHQPRTAAKSPAPDLGGKVALVTGAATGIGQAIAVGIESAGGTAVAIAADVTSRAEYQAMIEQTLATIGRWDILVNNAAAAITKPTTPGESSRSPARPPR